MGNRVARTVGRYEILEELGRGGMATVYLARQADLDRLVALKELSSFRQSDPGATRRFLRESRVAGSLSHPNIVTVHDYFESDGAPYIAMEYVSRGSLRPHIGHLPLTQVAGVLEGILAALGHAEQHHIVHRDLKPENVMVTEDGRVKLTDFGIAKATGQAFRGSFLTAAGTTVGTPNYMAPEQAMGQDVGPWTDLYSVGVMAFEMFVGEVPFHDTDEPVAVLMRQVSDPVPPARSLNSEVDQAISDWIERLVVKEPEGRLQSAGEASNQLEEIVLDLAGPRWRRVARLPTLSPTVAAAPGSTVSSTRPTTPRRRTPSEATTARRGTRSRETTRPVRDRDPAALAPTVMPTRPREPLESQPRDEQHRRPRRRAVLTAGFALLAALVALAAAFGGRGSNPGASPRAADSPAAGASDVSRAAVDTPVTSISGKQLALAVPRGWSRISSAPRLGLALSDPVALSPRTGSEVVEFGVTKGDTAANSALLAAAFLGSIGQQEGTVPTRAAVRLPTQRLEAWRYANLRPGGTDRQLTVYTVPTTAGVATVACATSPARAAGFAQQCEAIAGTLQLRDARPYAVGPSQNYANALNAATSDLQRAAQAQEVNLQSARTLTAQAGAAQALGAAYEAAAGQLAGLDVSPADRGVNSQLVSGLRSLGRAYQRMARAATAADAARYRTASAAIPAAKTRVTAALAAVRANGYTPATSTQPSKGQPSNGSRPSPSTKSPASSPTDHSGDESDVGDSRSDDPSDDEGDAGEP